MVFYNFLQKSTIAKESYYMYFMQSEEKYPLQFFREFNSFWIPNFFRLVKMLIWQKNVDFSVRFVIFAKISWTKHFQ